MKYRRLTSLITALALVFSAPVAVAAASKAPIDQSGYTAQSYNTDTTLQTGTVVQIDTKDSAKVKPASKDQLDKAIGVVVSSNSLPISVSNTSAKNQAFVATSGRQSALVTTENGDITNGDLLAISSLNGTLMVASDTQKTVFAKALTDFTAKDNRFSTVTLKDEKGKPFKKVSVGVIPVAIGVMKNPGGKSTTTNLPSQLQRIGQAIADKPVNGFRIYFSVIIMVLSVMVALSLLYVGVRSALIAIGRNPLAKKSIFKALLEVVLTSVLVLIIGLFTVYLILRL
jgi:hypothetical protein